MTNRLLQIRLPDLDGPRALQLIGILDAIVAELWLHYGDVIVRDSEVDFDPDPESEDPERQNHDGDDDLDHREAFGTTQTP